MPVLATHVLQAHYAYAKGNYTEALDSLNKIRKQVADDVKVLHNIILVEFAKDNCKNPKAAMKRLKELLHHAGYNAKREKRAKKLAGGMDSKEKSDADHAYMDTAGIPLVAYNLAALLHQARHTSQAINHLESIIESRVSGALLLCRAGVLLLELYSMMLRGCACLPEQRDYYLERASTVIEICSVKRSWDSVHTDKKTALPHLTRQWKLRLNIAIAKVYLAVEDARKSKKPLMAAGTLLEQFAAKVMGAASQYDWNDRTSDFGHTVQMLRAHHDYLRHEYRKSVKTLHAFNPTGPLQALFYNNMGCIHYKLNKFTSAAFYFTRALQVSVAQKQKSVLQHETDRRPVAAHNQRTALGNHGEVSYNNGMALLAARDYVSAFKCFQKAIFVFSSWPCLWFRMAECCIKAHRNTPPPLVKAAVGSGKLHRFLLNSSPAHHHQLSSTDSSPSVGEAAGDGGHGDDDSGNGGDDAGGGTKRGRHATSDAVVRQFMTLQHAHQYLHNAIVLLDRYASRDGLGSSVSPGTGGGNHSGGSSKADTSPLTKVYESVLLNIAYVSLCLNNPVQTVLHAEKLLAQPNVDPITATHARLYCAEAQCLLSRLADAQRTLEVNDGQHLPPRERSALLIASANVHILQQQFEEAEAACRSALRSNPSSHDALRLMVYINLKRGRTARVLMAIKTHEVPPE